MSKFTFLWLHFFEFTVFSRFKADALFEIPDEEVIKKFKSYWKSEDFDLLEIKMIKRLTRAESEKLFRVNFNLSVYLKKIKLATKPELRKIQQEPFPFYYLEYHIRLNKIYREVSSDHRVRPNFLRLDVDLSEEGAKMRVNYTTNRGNCHIESHLKHYKDGANTEPKQKKSKVASKPKTKSVTNSKSKLKTKN